MHKYLEKKGEVNFDKIFNQVLGKLSHKTCCKVSELCIQDLFEIR
jgi:beta-adrenergic-receptor kinase